MTNGDLMRIAETDVVTMHGWQYLKRSLPEAERQRLEKYFSQFRRDEGR